MNWKRAFYLVVSLFFLLAGVLAVADMVDDFRWIPAIAIPAFFYNGYEFFQRFQHYEPPPPFEERSE